MARNDLYRQLDANAASLAAPLDSPDLTALKAEIARLQQSQPTTRLDPNVIVRSPYQPRKHFDPIAQDRLTANIREFGILQNLVVRPINGGYELVAGERRLISAMANNLPEVPVAIFELSDRDARRWALAENIQREDLNPIEETLATLNLLAIELGVESIEEVKSILYNLDNTAKKKVTHNVVGNSNDRQVLVDRVLAVNTKGMSLQSFVSHRIPLLNLPAEVMDAIVKGLEYTKAQAIAKVEDEERRTDLLRSAVDERMPLSEIKKQVKLLKENPDRQETGQSDRQSLQDRYKQISSKLQKSPIWENPKKQKSLEKLLAQIESLMEDYAN
jgi:ParB family transcriptional regulator, chromosome partitioning protein